MQNFVVVGKVEETRPYNWDQVPVKPPPRRKSAREKPGYPIMAACAEIAPNETWRKLFNDAREGTVPFGFTIRQDAYHVIRIQTYVKKIPKNLEIPTDPQQALADVIQYFNKYDTYRSTVADGEDAAVAPETTTLGNLQHRCRMRRRLVTTYVEKEGKKKNYSVLQKRSLHFSLSLGFAMKAVKARDLTLSDSSVEIDSVEGLHFSEKSKLFTISKERIKESTHVAKFKPGVKGKKILTGRVLSDLSAELKESKWPVHAGSKIDFSNFGT